MNKLLRYIELNITELCNFTCSFCPRGHGYPNQNVHMTLETLDLVLSQVAEIDQPLTIQLAGRGEPTLHNNFGELLERLFAFREINPHIQLEMNTNGNRLTRYLDLLNKMDRVTYNIYEENRKSFNVEAGKYPNFLVKDKTKPDDRLWKTRAGFIPLTEITSQSFEPMPRYGKFCHKPFEVVYINYNGDYNLCCDVWQDIEVFGNIEEESIQEYLSGNKRLLEYRKHLLTGKRDLEPCRHCNIRCSYEFIQRFEEVLKDRESCC